MAGGFSFCAHYIAKNDADAIFARNADEQMDRVRDIIRLYIRSGDMVVKKLAALPETRNAVLARIAAEADAKPQSADAQKALLARLEDLRSLAPEVEAAFCGYRNGTFLASPPVSAQEGYDPRIQSWYSDTAWGQSDKSITDVYISPAAKSLVATMAVKIKSESDDVLGVAAVDVNLGPLLDTLNDLHMGNMSYLVLFDGKGRVLLDPKKQENLLVSAADTKDAALLDAAELPEGIRSVVRFGTEQIVFSRFFGDVNVKAALFTDRKAQTLPYQNTAYTLTAVSVILALCLALLGFLIANKITRPLRALTRQSTALANGNMDALSPIPGCGQDISLLHGNLGRLTGLVMLRIQAETEKANKLAAYTRQEVTSLSNQAIKEAQLSVSDKISTHITPLLAEMEQSLASLAAHWKTLMDNAQPHLLAGDTTRDVTAQLAKTMARFAGQVTEIEQNAANTSLLSQSKEALTQEMGHFLETADTTFGAFLDGLQSVKTNIRELAGVEAKIRGLAEQTNLLGLSIAIEASQKGEGKGNLSEAAQSMRALAAATMNIAEEVNVAGNSLNQLHTANTLISGKSASAIKNAFHLAASLADAFNAITLNIATMTEQIRVLATALEEGMSAGESAADNAEKTYRITLENYTVLRSLDETAAKLSSLSHRLSRISREWEKDSAKTT